MPNTPEADAALSRVMAEFREREARKESQRPRTELEQVIHHLDRIVIALERIATALEQNGESK